jgi:nicotinamide/nicotinate riboside kinase
MGSYDLVETKLIGISGCTNSGKSTLCKFLKNEFNNSICLNQDDYYRERNEDNLEYVSEADSFNFDVITAIDMDRFKKDIIKLRDSGIYDFIFIDGFLIYADRELVDLLDIKYFILLNKEESRRRRESRQYKTIDTPNYFEKCVWVEYSKYLKFCKSSYIDIIYIDGTNPIQEIVNFVINDFKRCNFNLSNGH